MASQDGFCLLQGVRQTDRQVGRYLDFYSKHFFVLGGLHKFQPKYSNTCTKYIALFVIMLQAVHNNDVILMLST